MSSNQINMFFPSDYNSNEIIKMINTLKVLNNFENLGLELMVFKNLSFSVVKSQNHSDFKYLDHYFSEQNGEYYCVSKLDHRNIRHFQTFGSAAQIIPKSSPPYSFFKRSTGIKVGQNYWIVGGSVNPYNWGPIGTQKKSIIWFAKKLKWVDGPKLPEEIFLFYAAASAINSTHVIFVGANTNYDGEGLKKLFFIKI